MLKEGSHITPQETQESAITIKSLLQPYASVQLSPEMPEYEQRRINQNMRSKTYEVDGKILTVNAFLERIDKLSGDRENITTRKDKFPSLIKNGYDIEIISEIWRMVPGLSEPLALVSTLFTLEPYELSKLTEAEKKLLVLTAVSEERHQLSFKINLVRAGLSPIENFEDKDRELETLANRIEELPNTNQAFPVEPRS